MINVLFIFQVWYKNVPHTGLVSYKKDQQWVKRSNDRLIFPGGGTQFKHGALHYIDYVEEVRCNECEVISKKTVGEISVFNWHLIEKI